MAESDAGPAPAASEARDPEGSLDGSRRPPSDWLRWLGLGRRQQERGAADAGPTPDHGAGLTLDIASMGELKLYDVAVPRADIAAVPSTASLSDLLTVFRDSGFTRLPVYDETLDNPLGLIHLKDVSLTYGFGCDADTFDLSALIRPLLYAPPSMRIGALLQKMQAARQHMALVIDEYGGVDGLVTMEDLVEQIVGEIADEHDAEEGQLWSEESEGVYLCQSRAPLEEFEAAIGRSLVAEDLGEDIDTLGGLVFMLAGRVPARGEVLRHPDGHEIEVIDADPRRIKRLRIRLAPPPGALDQAAE